MILEEKEKHVLASILEATKINQATDSRSLQELRNTYWLDSDDWSVALNSLVDKRLVQKRGDQFKLSAYGIERAKTCATGSSEYISEFYRLFYERAQSSDAHSAFCEEVFGKDLQQEGMTDMAALATLIEHPHGIDLGPLEPRLPEALLTPSGRPEFAHPDLIGDIPRLRELLSALPETSMQLINRRTLRSNNSWMHNLEVLVRGKPRCTLLVHPDDATRIGLTDGGTATVSSSAGSVALPVVINDGIRPGVVSIPHGWGHSSPGTTQSVARRNPGVNVNILTPTNVVDPLSGTSQLTGIPVTVTPG